MGMTELALPGGTHVIPARFTTIEAITAMTMPALAQDGCTAEGMHSWQR